MIYSMTGYGRAEDVFNDKQIIVELKSLNGKQFEVTNRMNPLLKKYEVEIRNILLKELVRGSVEVLVTIKQGGAQKPFQLNAEVAKVYFNACKTLISDLDINAAGKEMELLATILRLPEVVSADADGISEEEWVVLQRLLLAAAAQLMEQRRIEGDGLKLDISNRINNIQSLLLDINQFEGNRIIRIRERIEAALEDAVGKDKIDENRLEQELIYIIEKNDVSEEKQRLAAHCAYFHELVNQDNSQGIGKKLGFILQEVGREINTLGSKSNDADMQKIVVNMKDELEKAKEQSLNVL